MKNAGKELAHIVADLDKVPSYGAVRYTPTYDEANNVNLSFSTEVDFLLFFLELMKIEYDSGYGGQYLFGYIVFTDGTWLTRGEYDGSEWWKHHECPERGTIP
jgi:hypothetical protein